MRLPQAPLLLLAFVQIALAALPTPEAFVGFKPGTDRKLISWPQVVAYMRLAEKESPRIKVTDLGRTTDGNTMIAVTVSSPEGIRALPETQALQKRLAYPYDLPPEAAKPLLEKQKAVLLITCTIHSTEVGSTQMSLELIHRLATEDSPFVQRILDNVVLILVPSLNPDGQVIIHDWYTKQQGTPYEFSMLTELYHKYTGHDNNRDAFMNTQLESRLLNKLMYKDWFPVVYLDEHQMGAAGPRLFVPPFKDPINPNVDATIWQLNGLLGFAMGQAVHEEGKSGVIHDAMYTSWWQGGFLMQAWWHNMVGLLTEMASVQIATPIEQQKAPLGLEGEGGGGGLADPRRPLPPPRDTRPRNNYPRPWLGGKWTLRDIMDYELAATYGLLDATAANRHLLVRNFYSLNRKQIQVGRTEPPFAYVIPQQQHDLPVALHMLRLIDEQGGEVHRAAEPFEIQGVRYEPGTYVVSMAQPFRPFVKDLLEKQVYPVQRLYPGGPAERPYDVTGWTLPLQMGVKAVVANEPVRAKLERLTDFSLPGTVTKALAKPAAYAIPAENNNSIRLVNRLLKEGHAVEWPLDGGWLAPPAALPLLEAEAARLGLKVQPVPSKPATRKLKAPRIAIYAPWSPSMDEGWTRWLLEEYGFGYTRLRNHQIQSGRLREQFDVLLLADIPKESLLRGVTSEWTRPEHRGGLGADGVAALRDFVRSGGTLVALGNATLLPIEEFPLPLKSALKQLRPDQFSCPGSLLRVFVDKTNPIAHGMPDETTAVFYNDVAFDQAPEMADAKVKVLARYPSRDLLQSGWIGGEEHLSDRIAAAEVTYGKGRVVAFGFSVQNRAQPHATFKLFFQSLLIAGTE